MTSFQKGIYEDMVYDFEKNVFSPMTSSLRKTRIFEKWVFLQ